MSAMNVKKKELSEKYSDCYISNISITVDTLPVKFEIYKI